MRSLSSIFYKRCCIALGVVIFAPIIIAGVFPLARIVVLAFEGGATSQDRSSSSSVSHVLVHSKHPASPVAEHDIEALRPNPANFIVTLAGGRKDVGEYAVLGAKGAGESAPHGDVAHEIHLSGPIEIVQEGSSSDSAVIDWLRHWQSLIVSNIEVTDYQRATLANILDKSNLPSGKIFRLGEAIFNVSRDNLTACTFFKTAVERAHLELGQTFPGSPLAKITLNAGRSAKIHLWALYDETKQSNILSTLYTFNADLVHYILPTEGVLENARQHGYIGLIECLTLEGKDNDAVTLARSVDISSMNKEQSTSFSWAYAMALYLNGKPAEASAKLLEVMAYDSFKYQEDAYVLFAESQISTGNIAAAEFAGVKCRELHGEDKYTVAISHLVTGAKLSKFIDEQPQSKI